MSKTKIRLIADIILFVVFVVAFAPQATGIPWHEWISLLAGGILLIHLIINWDWIVQVTKKLFKKLPGETRFNHFWNTLLYLMMIIVMLSGVLVSEAVLPFLGFDIEIDPFWTLLHDLSANLFLIMIGIHLAMHWNWIKHTFNRYILKRTKRAQKPIFEGGK